MNKTITVAGTRYTIRRMSDSILCMTGPRGGDATLVRNKRNPTLWALVTSFGRRTVWFRATDTGLVPA